MELELGFGERKGRRKVRSLGLRLDVFFFFFYLISVRECLCGREGKCKQHGMWAVHSFHHRDVLLVGWNGRRSTCPLVYCR